MGYHINDFINIYVNTYDHKSVFLTNVIIMTMSIHKMIEILQK